MNLWTDSQAGTASYPTGGFVISTGLTAVNGFEMKVSVAGNLGQHHIEWSASGGDVTVKIMRHNYDKLASITSVTGLPSGVTAASTSGQNYDANTTHTHGVGHTHQAFTSSTPNSGSGGIITDVVGPENFATHTHTVTPPSISVTTPTGVSHLHAISIIYQHSHSITNTATDTASTELANGTDLSGATLLFKALEN